MTSRIAVFYFGRSTASPFEFEPDPDNELVDGGIRYPREINREEFIFEERSEDVYQDQLVVQNQRFSFI